MNDQSFRGAMYFVSIVDKVSSSVRDTAVEKNAEVAKRMKRNVQWI